MNRAPLTDAQWKFAESVSLQGKLFLLLYRANYKGKRSIL